MRTSLAAGLMVTGCVVLVCAGATSGATAAPGGRAAGAAFSISGNVAGLYPGAAAPLPLTVTNREGFAIVVTSIVTTATSAKPACASGDLSVSAFTGRLRVAAGGTGHTHVVVNLSHAAPNACKGDTFVLQYSGSASRP